MLLALSADGRWMSIVPGLAISSRSHGARVDGVVVQSRRRAGPVLVARSIAPNVSAQWGHDAISSSQANARFKPRAPSGSCAVRTIADTAPSPQTIRRLPGKYSALSQGALVSTTPDLPFT